MNETNRRSSGQVRLGRYCWTLIGLWTAAVGATLIWELIDERDHARQVARGAARGAFENDLIFRRWNAAHGGVYVPVTDKTQPNPYLKDLPGRDVTTTSGQRLTLVNPAYMMRQAHELLGVGHELRGHLTSLNPIRPENSPDPWEREALMAFERGQSEVSSEEIIDGQPYMRLMRPLTVEQSCLKCHAEQGYQVGDVRGGLSVSVPMASTWPLQRAEIIKRTAGYGMLWLLGLCGIVVTSRHLRRQIEHRREAETALRKSEARVRETAAHIPGVVYQFLWYGDGTYAFPYVSEGITRILGLTPEQVQSDSRALFPGLLFQEDADLIMKSIFESAEKMTTWQREMQMRSTGGEIKWIRAMSSPHSMPDGSVLFDGVFLDITDRKQAEQKLQEAHDMLEQRVAQRTVELQKANRELQKEIAERKQAEQWLLRSEEQFRSCFEFGLVGMAIVSPERDWVEVNGRLCGILGYSEAELLGKTWNDLTSADDLAEDEAQFDRALAGGINGYSMNKRFVHKNGRIVYTNLSVKCLHGGDGEVDCLVAQVQDVSELVAMSRSKSTDSD